MDLQIEFNNPQETLLNPLDLDQLFESNCPKDALSFMGDFVLTSEFNNFLQENAQEKEKDHENQKQRKHSNKKTTSPNAKATRKRKMEETKLNSKKKAQNKKQITKKKQNPPQLKKKCEPIWVTNVEGTKVDLLGVMSKKMFHLLTDEQKKRRKKLKNRISAEASRNKAKKRLETLQYEVDKLNQENESLTKQVEDFQSEKELMRKEIESLREILLKQQKEQGQQSKSNNNLKKEEQEQEQEVDVKEENNQESELFNETLECLSQIQSPPFDDIEYIFDQNLNYLNKFNPSTNQTTEIQNNEICNTLESFIDFQF
ncbi:x-box binding protein [Anaeramoeba flamelloides]|uniref:X-box binding protein n=1 Tax=Anaeramoeba flamelloides TaxID=1746091 RepID=A0AAV7YBU7_9EUKA|nr:x-box binding protein [Anaeramoeba flamelloides]